MLPSRKKRVREASGADDFTPVSFIGNAMTGSAKVDATEPFYGLYKLVRPNAAICLRAGRFNDLRGTAQIDRKFESNL
jgi:hypothetical protein